MGGLEVFNQRLLLVQRHGNGVDERARCRPGAAEFLGDLPQPRSSRDEWIVVEEQPMAGLQHIAMQRGLIQGQRVDGTQPPVV